MKLTLDSAYRWSMLGLAGRSYGSQKILPTASAIVIEVDDRHGKGKTTISDRVFYILEGEGEFIVGEGYNSAELLAAGQP